MHKTDIILIKVGAGSIGKSVKPALSMIILGCNGSGD